MEKRQFYKYIDYCDLEIVNLKILSNSLWDKKMVCVRNKPKHNVPIVNIYVLSTKESIFDGYTSYREKKMKEGFYIGHHFGTPTFIKIVNFEEIYLFCSDPGRIIWSYIFKIILTLFAEKQNMLHIKASSIEYKGKAFLVLGRGGCGKTEFIKEACNHGARLMGNTHSLIGCEGVFGIKSNIRMRQNGSEVYLPILVQNKLKLCNSWQPLSAIFWLNYRTDGVNNIKKFLKDELYQNIRWFSEGIANWEMKEDIADYVHNDPFEFYKFMNNVDTKVRQLVSNYDGYYINVDTKSKNGMEKTINLMDKLIVQYTQK